MHSLLSQVHAIIETSQSFVNLSNSVLIYKLDPSLVKKSQCETINLKKCFLANVIESAKFFKLRSSCT